MTHLPKRLLILATAACALGAAQPAAAQVQPAGTGEPAYTNSQQNTQWFEWPATSGADGYKVRFDYHENNTLVADPTNQNASNGAQNVWANRSGVRTLQHGGQYGICAQGSYSLPNDSLFFPDGPNSCSLGTQLGRRAYTTIDRSKPATTIALAGGRRRRATPSSTAEKANLSDAKCDSVLLDRTAPQVGINSATSAKVGELVSFGAQASDAGSVLAGGYEWTFGDNTGGGSGEAVNHTFTQPGTYEVRVEAGDAAGNDGAATKVVTVAPASTGGGPDGGGTGGGGTGGGATNGGGTTGGGRTNGGGTTGGGGTNGGGGTTGGGGTNGGGGTTGGSGTTTDGGSTDDGPGPSGDDTADDADGTLEVDAPRTVKLGKAKALRLALTADSPGRASFALVRAGRVLARGGSSLKAGTTSYRLKLPRKAKPGSYLLRVTFTPTGGRTTTSKHKVKLTGKAKARKATAATSRAAATRVSPAGAPSGLPNGRFHGERKRSFTPRVLAG